MNSPETAIDGPDVAVRPLLRRLRLDPWVLVAVSVTVFMMIVPAMSWLDDGVRTYIHEFVSTVLLLAIAVAVMVRTTTRLIPGSDRDIWRWLTLGLAAWLLGDLLSGFGIVNATDPTQAFLVDALFFFLYLAWILALDARPHLHDGSTLSVRARRLASTGRVLFLIGVFTYFIVLPRALAPDNYLSWVPSFSFYLALDVYLTGRLAHAAWVTPSPRWRLPFSLLALSFFFVSVTDCMDLAWMAFQLEFPWPVSLDVLYYLPMVLVVVASRYFLFEVESGTGFRTSREPVKTRGVPLIVYSLAFPIIHITLELGHTIPGAVEDARGILVITWLVLLGGINLLQNTLLERTAREQRERRKDAEAHVRYLSRHDALTGLLNRRELDREFTAALARTERTSGRAAVLFIDLDRFKEVNDTFGHQAGDAALRAVAQRLRKCVREVDSLFRYGGDEFVLLLESLPRARDAEAVIRRIEEGFERPVDFEGNSFAISASIGLAVWPGDGASLEELVQVADRAMYSAKGAAGA